MARVSPGRHEELEAFWRFHHVATEMACFYTATLAKKSDLR